MTTVSKNVNVGGGGCNEIRVKLASADHRSQKAENANMDYSISKRCVHSMVRFGSRTHIALGLSALQKSEGKEWDFAPHLRL